MSISEPCFTSPPTPALIAGVLQKSSGPLQRYESRKIEVHPDYLYIFKTDDPAPYSRISLHRVNLANTSDSPFGFALISRDQTKEGKVKFITESVAAKKEWLRHLHDEISKSMADVTLSSTTKVAINRRSSSIVEGMLEKRQGAFGSYHPRWCELRAGEGLSYSKYKSSPDESFKHVSLLHAQMTVNISKRRVQLQLPDNQDDIYLRCQGDDDFQHWVHALQAELGLINSASPVLPAPAESKQLVHDDVESEDDINLDFNDEDADSDEAFEFADLASPEPVRNESYDKRFSLSAANADPSALAESLQALAVPSRSRPRSLARGYGASPENRMVPVMLDSVSCEFAPVRATKSFEETELKPFLNKLDYNLDQKMQRFYDRLHLPLRGPYSAIYEHINLLDLDAKVLRQLISKLLEKYGAEEGLRSIVCDLDALLQLYKVCRGKYLLYREMAEFREQKGKCGLKLGVNGTIHFIDQLTRRTRETPTKENYEIVEKTTKALETCLEEFRLQFDVYDEAIVSIHEMENSLKRAYEWLGIHSRL